MDKLIDDKMLDRARGKAPKQRQAIRLVTPTGDQCIVWDCRNQVEEGKLLCDDCFKRIIRSR